MSLQFTVEHIGLASKDTTALKDWYLKVLGGKLVYEVLQVPPAYFVELGGGLIIEIYPARNVAPEVTDNGTGGWRHLALKVTSLEKAQAELAAVGVQITEQVKPAGGGGRVQFFRDPEGNLMHLVERESIFPPVK